MLPFLEILDTAEEKNKLLLLYKCFKNQLFYMAYTILKDNNKAEDMVHDVFMIMTKHLEKIDENTYSMLEKYLNQNNEKESLTEFSRRNKDTSCGKAWGYLSVVLKHRIHSLFIEEKRPDLVFVDDYTNYQEDEVIDSTELQYEKKETKEYIMDILTGMKYPYKEVLYLKYYNELSSEEIARILSKSPENIRQIAKRGRDQLKKQLERGGYHEF